MLTLLLAVFRAQTLHIVACIQSGGESAALRVFRGILGAAAPCSEEVPEAGGQPYFSARRARLYYRSVWVCMCVRVGTWVDLCGEKHALWYRLCAHTAQILQRLMQCWAAWMRFSVKIRCGTSVDLVVGGRPTSRGLVCMRVEVEYKHPLQLSGVQSKINFAA